MGNRGTVCEKGLMRVRTMPGGVKLPMSSWAACQLGGMTDCGGVSLKHSAEGMGGVCKALALGQALKLCAGVEKSIAPARHGRDPTFVVGSQQREKRAPLLQR